MKAGDIIYLSNNPYGQTHVIIMAVVDNYVMCRYPRCMPFCLPLKNFMQKFVHAGDTLTGALNQPVATEDILHTGSFVS